MATRDLTVRLRADIEGYRRAMAQAARATGDLERQGLAVQRAGRAMSAMGADLTRNLTVPIVAVGAAATKLSMDFDSAFTQMQSLAGVTSDEVAGLKDAVLDLAGETGRAPQELAEALFTLRSSGLDARGAMDALEAAAKASAAGLGDTQVIADGVSSAMLAYAESGMTAAQATDVFIATARAGKAEPAELASQMGRILPVASQLGISFEEVGGALAGLSLSGNDAAASSTLLSNVMLKLLKPSQQAVKQLDDIGLSVDDLQRMIARDGLVATLETLRDRLGDSGFVKFLEDAQAVQGGLALVNDESGNVAQALSDVAGSAGTADEAFATWADSMGAKNAQAFASMQTALIRFGDAIAPIVADVADFAAAVAEAFAELPRGAQQAILAVLGITAAVGPLVWVGGKLVSTLGAVWPLLSNLAVPAGTVSGAFTGAAASTSRFSSALGALGRAAAVVGVLVAVREALDALDPGPARSSMSELENQLLDLAETGEVAGETLSRVFDGEILSGELQKDQDVVGDLNDIDEALARLAARDPDAAAAAFERISEALRDEGFSSSQVTEIFDTYNDALAEADTANRTTGAAVAEATGELEGQAGATDTATSALRNYADALRAQFDPLFAAIDATRRLGEANAAVTEAEAALSTAIEEHGAESAEAMLAQQALTDAQLAAAEAALGQEGALVTLKDAVQSGSVSLDVAKAKLQQWVEQGLITQESADATARELDGVTWSANSIPDSINVDVGATNNASPTIADIQERLRVLPSGKTIYVDVIRRDVILPGSRNVPRRALGGPVKANSVYEVTEGGIPEMLRQGGRTYLLPGQDGTVIPIGRMTAGGGGAAATAGAPVIIDARGAVISSEAQFERMVVRAVQRAGEHGRAVTMRGRRL